MRVQLRQIFKVTIILLLQQTNVLKIFVPKRTFVTVPEKYILILFSFLCQFSLRVRSILYNCFSETLPQFNIKVIFQRKNCLNNLFWSRDSIPTTLITNFCVVVPSSLLIIITTFYGKIKRSLNIRSGENLSLIALTVKYVIKNNKLTVKEITTCFLITWFSWVFQFWHMSQIHINFLLKNFYWLKRQIIFKITRKFTTSTTF